MGKEISLLPIDVGFDVRALDMMVEIEPGISSVKHLTKDMKQVVASGSHQQIISELRQAGYGVM